MKSCSKHFAGLLLFLLFFSGHASASYFPARITEVVNSYTIKVLADGVVETVRLAGIVCPSTRLGTAPCAEQTKEFLLGVTTGKVLTVDFWATDSAGRSVCEVFLPDGTSLAKLLVAKGYALQDEYYNSNPEFDELERMARAEMLGVWGHLGHTF